MKEERSNRSPPPKIRPIIPQLKSCLHGDWFLHDVISLRVSRELTYQVLVRFRSARNVLADELLPIELFPFLIQGKRWRGGRPLDELAPLCGYEIDSTVPPRRDNLFWNTELSSWAPGDAAGHSPSEPMPALVFFTSHGNELWLTQAELLRVFYFAIPRATICFLSGMIITNTMSSSAFELWRPKQTGWIDQGAGIAKIQRSRNLSSLDAKRIAKLILHPLGAKELSLLWSWVQTELRNPGNPGLPPLGLPFEKFSDLKANWKSLPSQPTSRVRRRLITRIVEFRSPEPYKRLIEGADNDNRPAPLLPEGARPNNWPNRNTVRPQQPVSAPGGDPDPDLKELEILGVGVRDIAAEERITELKSKDHTVTEPGKKNKKKKEKDVSATSLGGPSQRGTDEAPGNVGDPDVPTQQSLKDDLKAQATWIELVLCGLTQHCTDHATPLSVTWLPSRDAAYVFRWPANNTDYAKKRSMSRCFLVAMIELGGRICYLVDPEQRVPSDTFSLGVIRGKHDPILQQEHFADLAMRFEHAHRAGVSWLANESLPEAVMALPIRRTGLKTENQKKQFAKRAVLQVLELMFGKPQLLA